MMMMMINEWMNDVDSQCVRGRVVRRGRDCGWVGEWVSVRWMCFFGFFPQRTPPLFLSQFVVSAPSLFRVLPLSTELGPWSVALGVWARVARPLCGVCALFECRIPFLIYPFFVPYFFDDDFLFFRRWWFPFFSRPLLLTLCLPLLLWLDIFWNLALVSILSVSHQHLVVEPHSKPLHTNNLIADAVFYVIDVDNLWSVLLNATAFCVHITSVFRHLSSPW